MVQTSKVNATAGVSKAGLAGILMTLGIVFGDIGTSPLYVMKAITHTGEALTENYVLGALFVHNLDAYVADYHKVCAHSIACRQSWRRRNIGSLRTVAPA